MKTIFWSKQIRKTREFRKTSNFVLTNLDQLKVNRARSRQIHFIPAKISMFSFADHDSWLGVYEERLDLM